VPEGHTVHRLARTFTDLFGHQALDVTSPQGRFAAGAALICGHTLVASEAWGKQLFLGFAPPSPSPTETPDPTAWLRIHLGLYGAWTFSTDGSTAVVHAIGAPRRRIGERETTLPGQDVGPFGGVWVPPEPRGAVRVRLRGAHAVADLTGPTACEVITPAEKAAVEARLGPDPLRPDGGHASVDAAREAFVAKVRRSRVSAGQQLMDQSVIAGVGNIYRAEALFRAGLDPLRPGRDVDAGTLRALWDDVLGLLHDGVAHGAIVTTRPEHRGIDESPVPQPPGRRRTRQNGDGAPGAVPEDQSLYVYHRDGLPCRVCGTPVLTKDLAGRSLYWCPACQR